MKYKTKLSHRQQQVYDLIRLGLSEREIAERIGVSRGTVSSFKQDVLLKKGVYRARELRSDVSTDNFPACLTRAQTMVLQAVVQGKTSKEIAEELTISPRTVQTHLANLYKRLGVKSRYQAAQLVLRGNEVNA